jgi:Flp pilus assembly protein protease CpaA
MIEVIFLIVLAIVWMIFASVQDLRYREVANWLNFSLIVFALGFRFFWSLFSEQGFMFFYQGLIGFAIFLALGNLFYYLRLFAGGDAKLMIALGAVLPFSENFYFNLRIFAWFLVIFLFVGAVYGLIWSLVLCLRHFNNFKKEFSKLFDKNKKFVYWVLVFGLFLMILGFIDFLFFWFGILVFILPYFYLYAKAVDECCMIKEVEVGKLVEGDWLYKNLKIGNAVVKAKWDGLNKKEIEILKKNKKNVLVRQGIAFVPVFLIAFLIFVYLFFNGFI